MMKLLSGIASMALAPMFLLSCSKPETTEFKAGILRCGWISAYSHPDERIQGGSLIFQVFEGSRACDLIKVSNGTETVLKTFELSADEGHVLCSTPLALDDNKINIGFMLNAKDAGQDGVDLEYKDALECKFGGGYQEIRLNGDLNERDWLVLYRVRREPSDFEWLSSHENSIEKVITTTKTNPVDYIVLRVSNAKSAMPSK